MMTGTGYRGFGMKVTKGGLQMLGLAETHNQLEWEVEGLGIFDSWNEAVLAVDKIATQPMPERVVCQHCGLIEVLCWGKHNQKLQARQACFSCTHFLDLLDDPRERIVVRGNHYMDCGRRDDVNKSFLGFGGAEWEIEFLDGRKISTNNLWSQGTIPQHLRHLFPDNARFVEKPKQVQGYICEPKK